MVCNMCDPEGNPCDRCKIMESDEGDYYLWQEEERLNEEQKGK